MRNFFTLFFAIGILLLLTACNSGKPSEENIPADGTCSFPTQSAPENSFNSSTDEELYPEHKTILVISPEKIFEVPSTLYAEECWRIYIPDEWIQIPEEEFCWQSDEDQSVILQVVLLSDISDYGTAAEYFLENSSAFDLQPTGNDAYIGSANGENLLVSFEGAIEENYCCIVERWSDEAPESARSTLAAIGYTFSFIDVPQNSVKQECDDLIVPNHHIARLHMCNVETCSKN